jgi:putative ABC transport system permease protein
MVRKFEIPGTPYPYVNIIFLQTHTAFIRGKELMKISLHRIALKNLRRKLFRSISIMLAAALATGLIFSSSAVLESVGKSLDLGAARLGADIIVVPEGYEANSRSVLIGGEPANYYMDTDTLSEIKSVKGVDKASPQLFLTSAVLACCSMPTVLLVGYDPATDFTVTPWIRYKHEVAKEEVASVVVGANTLYAVEGAYLSFYGKKFRIGNSIHPTGMRFLDYSIFMTMDAARDMIETSKTKSDQPLQVRADQISSVLVMTAGGGDISEIARSIEMNVPGTRAIAARDLVASVRRDVKGSLWSVTAAGIAAWLMTVLLSGIIFFMIVNERERELGLMRAMGATRAHVFRLLVSEALLLAGIGGSLGIIAGWIALNGFEKSITSSLGNIPLLWPSPLFIWLVGLACVLAMLLSGAAATMYPALRICRKEPYEAIRRAGMR